MNDRRPKMKGLTSLLTALVLLSVTGFHWWKLTYVHNPVQGPALLMWTQGAFDGILLDGSSAEGQLATNMGAVREDRIFFRMPFDDHRLFLILFWAMAITGVVQVYLAWYWLTQRE